MIKNTTATVNGQMENPIKWLLIIVSIVAGWIGVSAFLATIIKQDPLLIFLMAVAAVVFAAVTYFVIRIQPPIVPLLIAFVASFVLAGVAWSLLANSAMTPIRVTITEPQEGANVEMSHLAKGTVSDPDARVRVIVHPLNVPEMRVQEIPVVDRQGNWQSTVFFGTEVHNEEYQLIALAANENFLVTWATGNALSEGQKVTRLPLKSNGSNIATRRVTVSEMGH